MPSKRLNVISHCAKSPWFDCTWNEKAFYTEYAGRLVSQSIGNDAEAEYWKLRREVGLYDVPERPVEISGRDAVAFLNRVFTRPVDAQRVGRGAYGLLCHQGGGLVCDGIIFRLAEDRFWYVHADAEVYLWLVAHALGYAVEIRDPESWVLQVQGPNSLKVLANACDGGAPAEFGYFDIFEGSMGGQPVLISRTGWTNELGFEVYNLDPAVDGPALFEHLLRAGAEHGIVAASQASMNVRRIEGGILNYPTDITWDTTPWDVGIGAFVDLESHDFIGREALRAAVREPRFCGFKCAPVSLRYGESIMQGDRAVGRITAYEISPYLQCGVGYVLFDSPASMGADGLEVAGRDGNRHSLELVELPFYDAEKRIPRGLEPLDGKVE